MDYIVTAQSKLKKGIPPQHDSVISLGIQMHDKFLRLYFVTKFSKENFEVCACNEKRSRSYEHVCEELQPRTKKHSFSLCAKRLLTPLKYFLITSFFF